MIPAKDISRWQGTWQDTGEPIVMIKMSGGDSGLYFDSQASNNYNQAKAAGKHVGGYHFAGNTNAVAEANYFLQAMSPVAENDVYALDWELPVGTAGAVEWCQTFTQTIHNKIGVWPLIYMNLNTLNSYAWAPVLANCGLWLADWNNNPAGTISTVNTYVMQQYSDGPVYDHDEWFGSLEEFDAYGYHAPSPTPAAAPTPPAPVTPTPPTPPVAVPAPPVTPTTPSTPVTPTPPITPVSTTPPITPTSPKPTAPVLPISLWQRIWTFIKSLVKIEL